MNTKIKEFLTKYLWFGPVLVGFALRLAGLTRSSIWHDEGYTMWLLRYDIPGILMRTARDVHPPGYYLLAKPWVSVFGFSAGSIRFLSLLFSIGIIYLSYKIMERIWDRRAAFWTAMFVAISPFMIRFGQESRMYGVVAFFCTLATYLFVLWLKEKKDIYLWLWIPTMAIAIYTQYYAFFVLVPIWIILAVFTPEVWNLHWIKGIKAKSGVFNWKWWMANILLFAAYAPWFPVAYRQVTRVSGSYWIKPEWITVRTIPGSLSQFITYTHLDAVYNFAGVWGHLIYWIIIGLIIGSGLIMFSAKEKRKTALALLLYGYLPMLLIFTLSKLRTPVYQDRYFPFSAVAILAIYGVLISVVKNKVVRYAMIIAMVGAMLVGQFIMYTSVQHNMSSVADIVESERKSGDLVLSGELYTFLDGTYYLGDKNIKLMSTGVDGYGESSLFYDQQRDYIVQPAFAKNYATNRIWVVGKSGDKEYFADSYWQGWTGKVYFSETKSNGLKLVLYTRN